MPLKGGARPSLNCSCCCPSHKPLALLRKCPADLLRDGSGRSIITKGFGSTRHIGAGRTQLCDEWR